MNRLFTTALITLVLGCLLITNESCTQTEEAAPKAAVTNQPSTTAKTNQVKSQQSQAEIQRQKAEEAKKDLLRKRAVNGKKGLPTKNGKIEVGDAAAKIELTRKVTKAEVNKMNLNQLLTLMPKESQDKLSKWIPTLKGEGKENYTKLLRANILRSIE